MAFDGDESGLFSSQEIEESWGWGHTDKME